MRGATDRSDFLPSALILFRKPEPLPLCPSCIGEKVRTVSATQKLSGFFDCAQNDGFVEGGR